MKFQIYRFALLLLAGLLSWGLVHAQPVALPLRQDIMGFRGNVITSAALQLAPQDTLLSLSVKGYYSASNKSPVSPQPMVVRVGLSAIVQYPSSITLPGESYYELSAGSQVRFYGQVSVGKVGIVQSGISNTVLAGLLSRLGSLDAGISALSTTVGVPFRKSDADALYRPITFMPTATQVGAYSVAQIDTKLLGYVAYVEVPDYPSAVAIATGSLPKRIRVASDSNRGGYPMTYDYFPNSVDTDKLEPASF